MFSATNSAVDRGAVVVAGRRRRRDGTHGRPRRSDPCALRTAGDFWPFRCRIGIRLVQRRAKAGRSGRRRWGWRRGCTCSPATLRPSAKATGPIPPTRCCGVWVAHWHWSTPNSGAASSMSTSRCPTGLAARYVVDEAHAADGEDQVVYRAGLRRVPRLQRGYPPSASPAELDQGQQLSGDRRDRQYRAASDPAARRHGRRAPSSRYPAIPVRASMSWLPACRPTGTTSGDGGRRRGG